MSTRSTTSTENAFVATCTRCPRTATVHQRRRGGLDGFATVTTWHGRHIDGDGQRCGGTVPASALRANLDMLRARAAGDDPVDSVRSTWGFNFTPEVA